jgi:hypothetical protein
MYNTHNTNIYAPAGFEPVIPASNRPLALASDRSATSNRRKQREEYGVGCHRKHHDAISGNLCK